MMMHNAQQKTQSAHRAERLRFALQMAEQAQKVGERIAEEREKRNWSRPEMARRLPGVSTGNDVYRWEKGDHLPQSDTLSHIAEALETTIEDLYAGPIAEREEQDPTPDVLEELSTDQLARIEKKLDNALKRLDTLEARLT